MIRVDELAAVETLRSLFTEQRSSGFAVDDGEFVVAVRPRPVEAEQVAVPGGVPAERLHLSLVYVRGSADEFGEAALEAMGEVADEFGELVGEVVGAGVLGDDEATVLLVNTPGLGELRDRLVEGLVARSVPVDEGLEFVPHITVGGVSVDDASKAVGAVLTFRELVLMAGDQVVPVALMGDGVDDDEEDEMGAAGMSSEERAARVAELVAVMRDAGNTVAVDAGQCGCGGKKGGCSMDPAAMVVDRREVFAAIAPHSTDTSDDSWDGPANERRVRSPESEEYFARVYAWRDDEADTSVKAAYRFIHHFVSEDGDPGAASTVACSTGIGVLNGARGGTTIPDEDRRGVWEHLAAHLRDAGLEPPELLSGEDAAVVAAAFEAGVEIDPADHGSVVAALKQQRAGESGCGDGDSGRGVDELVAELARRWAEQMVAEVQRVAAGMVDAAVGDELGEDDGGEPVMVGEFVDGDGFDWTGVLIPEGVQSGDGRMVAEGALTWRELPLPLMLQTVNAPGHDGAVLAGQIRKIERVGNNIVGWGVFDDSETGREYRRLVTEGMLCGVSADIDSVVVEFRDAETGDPIGIDDLLFGDRDREVVEVLVQGRIMGATGTPFPAFQEARIELLGSAGESESLVAAASWVSDQAGVECVARGDGWRVSTPVEAAPWVVRGGDPVMVERVLVAAGSPEQRPPLYPPLEWFEPTGVDEPFTVHPDGRITGLVARWGSCHIGMSDRCVDVPRSNCGYAFFRTKKVLTAEGVEVATGPVFMDTVHPSLALSASDAQAHYHHTGCAVADVAVFDTDHGIEVCGAVRPDVPPEKVRALRGSDLSPDWRMIRSKRGGRRLEMVGLLAVNVSGFVVENLSLVAAGGGTRPVAVGRFDSVEGEVTALVAAGVVSRPRPFDGAVLGELRRLSAEVEELRAVARRLRAEVAVLRMTKPDA